jgi:hypothetical protein
MTLAKKKPVQEFKLELLPGLKVPSPVKQTRVSKILNFLNRAFGPSGGSDLTLEEWRHLEYRSPKQNNPNLRR